MSYTNTSAFAKGMLNLPVVAAKSPLSIAKSVKSFVNKTPGFMPSSGFLGSGSLKRGATGLLDWAPQVDWMKERNWGGMLPWRWADKGDGSPPVMQDWGKSSLGGGSALKGGWNSPQQTYQRAVDPSQWTKKDGVYMDTTFMGNPYGENRTQYWTPSTPDAGGGKWADILKRGLLGLGIAGASNQENQQSEELPLMQSARTPMNFSYHQGM